MATLLTPGVYLRHTPVPRALDAVRTDVAGFVGLAERGPLNDPVRVTTFREFQAWFGGFLPYAHLAYAVRAFFENGGDACWVVRVAGSDVARAEGTVGINPVAGSVPIVFRVEARSAGRWGNALTATLLPPAMALTRDGLRSVLTLLVLEDGQFAERFSAYESEEPTLSASEALIARVAAESRLVSIGPAVFVPDLTASTQTLVGGRDGLATLSVDAFTGVGGGAPRGLATLANVDEVAILAMPDLIAPPSAAVRAESAIREPEDDPCDPKRSDKSSTSESDPPEWPPVFDDADIARGQAALIAQCEALRDRFVILDPPLTGARFAPETDAGPCAGRCFDPDGPDQAEPVRDAGQLDTEGLLEWRRRPEFETRFAALYYPWLRLPDPLQPDSAEGRLVPPSGHVAGIYAATDRTEGVFRPPANRELTWVTDVAATVDDARHGLLNPMGINAIRAFPGRGIRVYGARTLSSEQPWMYVNVRRLMSMLGEAIEEGLQWAVFEPHDGQLRFGIRSALGTLLDRLWRRGAFAGATPDAAYEVRCDGTTTTPADEAAGRVVAEVRVAPVIPYEFVVLRIGVAADELRVSEG